MVSRHDTRGTEAESRRGAAGEFGRPLTEFFALFPATVELSICAMLLAVAVGIPAGVFAASRRNADECSTRARSRWNGVREAVLAGSTKRRAVSWGP